MVREEIKTHQASIALVMEAPGEVAAGSEMTLRVSVTCPAGCDLRGTVVKIVAEDATLIKEVELTQLAGTGTETDEFAVRAPVDPGEHTWSVVFPAQEDEGTLHAESTVPLPFVVKPHATSMAAWDVPFPLVLNSGFTLRVGVKCAANCRLTGSSVEVYDQEGDRLATGILGDTPWAGTPGLFWTEVELEAPGVEGSYTWTVEFPTPNLELAHEGASCAVALRTSRPAEHVVTVEVRDRSSKAPVKNARVLLHPFKGRTDESGVARIAVSRGAYKLSVSAVDYVSRHRKVDVAGDVTLTAELEYSPYED